MNPHADRDGSEQPSGRTATPDAGTTREQEVEALRAEVERLEAERRPANTSGVAYNPTYRERWETLRKALTDAEVDTALQLQQRLAAEAERDRLAAVVEQARAVHAPCSQYPTCSDDDDFCHECGDDYPCLTVRTLDGAQTPQTTPDGPETPLSRPGSASGGTETGEALGGAQGGEER
jgi:hypothetical protein